MTTRRYTFAEAAAELRITEHWLRRHIRKLPHTKIGRVVTFSEEDIARITAMHRHEPAAAVPPPAVGVSSEHPLAFLKPIPTRRAS